LFRCYYVLKRIFVYLCHYDIPRVIHVITWITEMETYRLQVRVYERGLGLLAGCVCFCFVYLCHYEVEEVCKVAKINQGMVAVFYYCICCL